MSTQQAAAETNGTKPATRIAIVGTGQVGGAAAYALILSHVADELLLVDSNPELRDGQVRDLTDVAYSHQSRTRVHAGSYHEAGQCDIIVLAAGCKYTTGQTTIENVSRNISIVRTVVDAMRPFQPNAILLVVANPVDLLTSLAQKLSRLPPAQVLGSGTFLDSLRLRGLLADRAGVALDSVHVDILGVHGDPQVVAWSAATIGGSPVDKALPPPDSVGRAELESECRTRSRTIIRAKGATPFGIGSAVTTICASILQDRRSVRPVSHFHPDSDCCYSLPAVLGRKGVLSTIPPHLNQEEETSISSSAKELQATVERILLHGHRSI